MQLVFGYCFVDGDDFMRIIVSLHLGNPAVFIRRSAFLNIQHFLSDFIGDRSYMKFLVNRNLIILSLILDVIDSTDDDCCSGPEALE